MVDALGSLNGGTGMTYFLSSTDGVLGRTGRELPCARAAVRTWTFSPTSAGMSALPAFEEAFTAMQEFVDVIARSIGAVGADERVGHIARLTTETAEGRRLRAADEALVRLALAVRDERGNTLECTSPRVSITDQVLGTPSGLSDSQQESMERAGGPPAFMLVVQLSGS